MIYFLYGFLTFCIPLISFSLIFPLKNIFAAYNKQAAMTVEDAMVGFLKVVCKWPTFGCAFFEVKVMKY